MSSLRHFSGNGYRSIVEYAFSRQSRFWKRETSMLNGYFVSVELFCIP